MANCKNYSRYKGLRPPRCLNGKPCDGCKSKRAAALASGAAKLTIDEMADAFAAIERIPLEPVTMITSDPRLLGSLPPGTYALATGKEPVRIGEAEQFEQIGYSALLRREMTAEELAQ